MYISILENPGFDKLTVHPSHPYKHDGLSGSVMTSGHVSPWRRSWIRERSNYVTFDRLFACVSSFMPCSLLFIFWFVRRISFGCWCVSICVNAVFDCRDLVWSVGRSVGQCGRYLRFRTCIWQPPDTYIHACVHRYAYLVPQWSHHVWGSFRKIAYRTCLFSFYLGKFSCWARSSFPLTVFAKRVQWPDQWRLLCSNAVMHHW